MLIDTLPSPFPETWKKTWERSKIGEHTRDFLTARRAPYPLRHRNIHHIDIYAVKASFILYLSFQVDAHIQTRYQLLHYTINWYCEMRMYQIIDDV